MSESSDDEPSGWQRWFPFWETARTYQRAFFRHDLTASITVALLEVPQAIAYAIIAGLPPAYGLYTSVVTGFVSALLNHSNYVICGPTNAISIMVASVWLSAADPAMKANPAAVVTTLTLLVGLVQVALGLLKVGNLSQFVSRSVLVGFTAGAGLLIALDQLPPLLGVSLPPARHLLGHLGELPALAQSINPYTVALGLLTVLLVRLGKQYAARWPAALLAVIIAAVVTQTGGLTDYGVELIGDIPRGLPPFAWPTLRLQQVADLAGAALAIAILGCISTMSISKSIALSTGERTNNNQDFFGMGVAHVVGAFFSSHPGCGSFTRSALSHATGAKTRLAGLLSAVWVGTILVLLGPFARYIPRAALAGLLISLGLSLLNWQQIRVALRATRSDAIVLVLTFGCTLMLHLDTAIYVGVMSSLVLFLRKASAPHLVEYDLEGDQMREITDPKQRSHPEISIIHVEGELFFGAAELFEEEVRRLARDPNVRVVILRMKNARHLDATAVMALQTLHKFLRDDHRLLLISGASPDVMRVLRNSGLVDKIGADCVFEAEENLTAATRKALLKAREFLGGAQPEVRVFYEQSRLESKPGS